MKELEKTKRISIAAVLTILVVIIALLSYKRPSYVYHENVKESLASLTEKNYFVNLNEINENYTLIDIRSQIDYNKGHINNAINIYAPDILNKDNFAIIEDIKAKGKTIVLYATNPNESIAPFMVLNQIGVQDIKILKSNLSYNQDKLVVKPVTQLEKYNNDIKAYIDESIKKATVKPKPTPKPKPVVKKVIVPKKKKKKMPVEGGC